MKLTVFHNASPTDSSSADPAMFFDLNGNTCEFTNNVDRAVDVQVMPVDQLPEVLVNAKLKIKLAIFHNCEYQVEGLINDTPSDCVIITNAVSREVKQGCVPNLVHNDFLFNRTKAYYSGFEFNIQTSRWYFYNQRAFVVPDLVDGDYKTKIYVAPNKTYLHDSWRVIKFRPQLVRLLLEQFREQGYIGQNDFDSSLFLISHVQMPDCLDFTKIVTSNRNQKYQFNYCPPHNEYYKHTFISIYAETIEHGPSIVVTEKTYDPLIKGHFILPFSCTGFIDYLLSLGFKLPNFIDYGYDQQTNDEKRFNMYTNEIKRLMSMSMDVWRDCWDKNQDIIKHNQLMFFNRDYDRVDFSKIMLRLV